MISRVAIAAFLMSVGAGAHSVLAQAASPTFGNVAYGGASPAERLDIYLPPGNVGPRPVLVFIHGGGWQSGDKSAAANKAPALLARGFAVVGINYRLSGEAIHPAQVNDCRGAIRWLRSHAATYGLDPSRIGVWGTSAGGHLVAHLGTTGAVMVHEGVDLEGNVGGNLGFSSRVQAVVDHFGPTDFFTLDPSHQVAASPESLLVGFWIGETLANLGNPAFAAKVSTLESVSSVTFVTPDDPPFLIAHGSADPVVPPAQSQELYDLLTAAGVSATLRYVQGAGHGLPATEEEPARAFLAQALHVAPCPGDCNGDRRIDTADLSVVLGRFGQAIGAGNPGELTGDTVVNTADLALLLGSYGTVCVAP